MADWFFSCLVMSLFCDLMQVEDASLGPLQPGQIGIIDQVDDSSQVPFLVRRKS